MASSSSNYALYMPDWTSSPNKTSSPIPEGEVEKNEAKRLKEENAKLVEEISGYRKLFEECQEALQTAISPALHKKLGNRVKTLEARLEKSKINLEDAKRESMEAKNIYFSEIQRLNAELKREKVKRAQFQREVKATKEMTNEENERLRQKCDELELEIIRTEQQFSKAVQTWKDENYRKLKNKCRWLQNQLKKGKEVKRRTAKLGCETKQFRLQRDRLRRTEKQLRRSLRQERDKTNMLDSDILQLQCEKQQLMNENNRLETEMQGTIDKLNEQETATINTRCEELLQKNVSEMEHSVWIWSNRLAEVQTSNAVLVQQADEMRRKIRTQQEQIDWHKQQPNQMTVVDVKREQIDCD